MHACMHFGGSEDVHACIHTRLLQLQTSFLRRLCHCAAIPFASLQLRTQADQ